MIGPDASPSLGKSPQDWGVIKRVSLNTFWLTAARLGSQVLLMLFTVLVARRMGETGLGGYAYMTAVIFIGNVFSTFGTDMLLMREIAAHKDFSLLVPSRSCSWFCPRYSLAWYCSSFRCCRSKVLNLPQQ